MADVREVAVRYRTTDGRVHTVKAEAEAAQRLLDAEKAYHDARTELDRALLATQLTADGKPMRLGYLTTFYVLKWNAFFPTAVEVRAQLADVDVVLEDGLVTVRVVRYQDGGYTMERYGVRAVYADRENAEREAQRQRVLWIKDVLRAHPEMRDVLLEDQGDG